MRVISILALEKHEVNVSFWHRNFLSCSPRKCKLKIFKSSQTTSRVENESHSSPVSDASHFLSSPSSFSAFKLVSIKATTPFFFVMCPTVPIIELSCTFELNFSYPRVDSELASPHMMGVYAIQRPCCFFAGLLVKRKLFIEEVGTGEHRDGLLTRLFCASISRGMMHSLIHEP